MPPPPRDPALPRLEAALDLGQAEAALRGAQPALAAVRLEAARLLRHKPGKRCLIEYRLSGPRGEEFRLLGKMQAKGVDRKSLALQQRLHVGPFGPAAPDGIRVPEPLGGVPDLHLWLQHWVPGTPLGELLGTSAGPALAARAADALVKLRLAGPPPVRTWTLADELRILRERHDAGVAALPTFAADFAALLSGAASLAALVPPGPAVAAHRDFHQDQLMLHGEELYLVDLDVHALADPALDAGNFEAHLLDLKIRGGGGGSDALGRAAMAFRARFAERSPEVPTAAIEHYLTLSLVRLVFLAPLFPERHRTLPELVGLARARLHLAGCHPVHPAASHPCLGASHRPRPARREPPSR